MQAEDMADEETPFSSAWQTRLKPARDRTEGISETWWPIIVINLTELGIV